MNEFTIKVLKAAVCAAASYLAGKAVDAAANHLAGKAVDAAMKACPKNA